MNRFRIQYSKTEPLRYTGMLDIQHIWERLFRRAHLDLAYSQGFHPQPRIQQAAPLPLSFISSCELLDFWLDGEVEISSILDAIKRTSQPGLEIQHMEEVDIISPPLQTMLETATYAVVNLVEIDSNLLTRNIARILNEQTLIRERRNKTYDLRPLILELNSSERAGEINQIEMKLSAREAATGRPDEVTAALGYDPLDFRYLRSHLGFSSPVFSSDP